MTPFPILRVPRLVWSAILNGMSFNEIVKLAKCSRKTNGIVKALAKMPDILDILNGIEVVRSTWDILELLHFIAPIVELVTISFMICDELYIIISVHHSIKIFNFKTTFDFERPQPTFAEVFNGEFLRERRRVEANTDETFWRYRPQGVKKFLAVLEAHREDLHLKVQDFDINQGEKTDFPVNLKIITDWVTSKNLEVQNLKLAENLTQKDFESFFYSIQPTESLTSKIKMTPGFRVDQNLEFKIKNLFLWPGKWFTFENLMRCDAIETIEISESEFDSNNILAFLRHWRNGKWVNLKKFALITGGIVTVNVGWIFDKLEKDKSPYRLHLNDLFSYIERKDGLVASITSTDGNLQPTHMMTMIVQPAGESNPW